MTKTLALLLDSYRELNAKRLFWIVLALSAGVVGIFAMIGETNGKLTFLWWDTPFPGYQPPDALYKWMFSVLGVKWWLSVCATGLALISTAGTFPDLMASGSIDLYLSKPLSRIRLFLTKYLGGLLFAALQVTVFSIAAFLLLGIRGHSWEPGVFLAIPIVVAVFSYLFSVCVLLGVMTRSTVASLLIVGLLWFLLWGVQFTEFIILNVKVANDLQTSIIDRQIARAQTELDHFPARADSASTEPTILMVPPSIPGRRHNFFFQDSPKRITRSELQTDLDQLQSRRIASAGTGQTAERVALATLTILPKTDATTDLMTHQLNKALKLPGAGDNGGDDTVSTNPQESDFIDPDVVKAQVDQVLRQRTAGWVLSTSFTFEIIVIALAGWMFCRRDY